MALVASRDGLDLLMVGNENVCCNGFENVCYSRYENVCCNGFENVCYSGYETVCCSRFETVCYSRI